MRKHYIRFASAWLILLLVWSPHCLTQEATETDSSKAPAKQPAAKERPAAEEEPPTKTPPPKSQPQPRPPEKEKPSPPAKQPPAKKAPVAKEEPPTKPAPPKSQPQPKPPEKEQPSPPAKQPPAKKPPVAKEEPPTKTPPPAPQPQPKPPEKEQPSPPAKQPPAKKPPATKQEPSAKTPPPTPKPAPSPAATPPEPKFPNAILWDDFGETNEWVAESAAAPARLSISTEEASVGEKSLRIAFTPSNRESLEIRRETRMDLTLMDYLLMDVYVSPKAPMTAWVGFRTGPTLKLFEAPPAKLKAGWNKDIAFDLRAVNFKINGDGENDCLFDYRDDVRRVSLMFGKGANRSGVIYVDNIQFVGNPQEGWQKIIPRIREVLPSATALTCYDLLEIEVKFDATYTSHFDASEIDLWATLLGPDGKERKAYGFFYGMKQDKGKPPRPVWLIRFTPNRPGRWEYNVTVKNGMGEDTSSTFFFECADDALRKGFITRSSRDSRQFEFESGEYYYPIGQNICWSGDYEYYFKKMRDAGENFVRIWMCPWNLRLECPKTVGEYDLAAAKALDGVIELARQYGLYVQLVFEHHGMLNSDNWAQNPYNSANGGPCESAMDFFVDAEARKLFKRRLRYIAARWGYATSIFAWELFNEVDLTDYYSDDEVVKWHNEMATYLKSVDAHGHLITTSCYGTILARKLNAISRINFAQAHLYTLSIIEAIEQAYRDAASAGKPFFVGEFGGGTTPEVDMRDPNGVILHAGLWTAFMTPCAGSAMPWWWDTLIDPKDLYYHYKAIAAFAEGEDRRGKGYKPVKVTVDLSEDKRLVAIGLLCQKELLLWVYDPDVIEDPDNPEHTKIPGGTYVWLVGMPDGDYHIEYWDTYEGKVLHEIKKKSYRGRLQIVFPEADRDIACKVKFQGKIVSPSLVPHFNENLEQARPFDGRTP